MDWSPDGRFVLYENSDPPPAKKWGDLWAVPVDWDRKPFPVVASPSFQEQNGQFSPADGKWIAYESDESGQVEIYLQPFRGPGSKTKVSTKGGAQVRWRGDGKELFYIALDERLMAVPIRLPSGGENVDVGTPVPLFVTRVGGSVQSPLPSQYVVSPDGQRFLMSTVAPEATSPITVILNWTPKP